MNLFADMRTHVIAALDDMVRAGQLPEGLSFDNVAVEPPREAAHGDMATNAAMVLAKPADMKPRDLAQNLAARLGSLNVVESADVAGPGFLNLRLSSALWSDVVSRAQEAGFGASKLGAGAKVNVEYVSANPTGPLHVGHTRGAVFGDALANLLAFAGYDVTREYYINDGGAQVDVLARSVYLRYLEAHGQEVSFPDGTYPGDYLKDVGEGLKARVGDAYVGQPEDAWLADVREFATEAMMTLIRNDLASLGVKMDVFYSEKSLYGTGRIEEALKELDGKGLIYKGTLEPPKGKLPDDWEPREQTLFRSTAYGDDVDRPVMKSDGAWTYFAPDIAYHWDKIDRGFDQLIDVFGADHGGYVKRMKAAVAALSDERVPLDVKLCQLVRLYDKGEPFKMSKRAGTFVMLSDVVERVGKDVVRFLMLTRKNDAPLDFDLAKAVEESRDNPVWYVQYTHARIRSVMRKADGMGVAPGTPNLTHPAEIEVAKKLAEFPRIVEIAAKAHEPHRIAFYLGELAQVFNSLWNAGDGDHAIRFLHDSDSDATAGKIPLPLAVSVVIAAGLGILGVDPVEEMR
ncbi:Arginine--tRNA ligase [Rhodobacteraceae bacterium THAF1]|uniref:arginine--tRNA ligase n=1 Tax=Palleronia sp. THAF1 TaxID=2587842 RepID=UPI000F3EBEE3|nr:arginine--tRNA ligase [Palleronia sp. THAF1]QFU08184.1 Arginine--tRNA ligase [Palleronia sp. THAF1]VDC28737.1 Arginine--tRNA ligase [Rhodobacteraceae bacterium THAF1]